MFFVVLMLSRLFFPNFGQGPFPKIAGKGPGLGISALDKLLGQLGFYATSLSSIAYLQKQLRIFYIFLLHVFAVITYVFLLNKAIVNVPTY